MVLIVFIAFNEVVKQSVHAFVPQTHSSKYRVQNMKAPTRMMYKRDDPTTIAPGMDLKAEISAMGTKDIREELQSHGISTASYFEKSELVDALVKARQEEKVPIIDETTASYFDTSDVGSSSDNKNREGRIEKELQKCLELKVGELKRELESYGKSIKSFFEKSDMARALAQLRVDGVQKSTSFGSNVEVDEERWDPSYRDVVVSKLGVADARLLLDGGIIDVLAR